MNPNLLSGSNRQEAIQLGSLLAPGANGLIQFMIPSLNGFNALTNMNTHDGKPLFTAGQETESRKGKSSSPKADNKYQNLDKLKGCPYPQCNRYGKSFSRGHDLKRHIMRHEIKQNTKSEDQPKSYPNTVGTSIFMDEHLLEKHRLIYANTNPTITPASIEMPTCHICDITFETEELLNSHLRIHVKPEPAEELLNSHLRIHVKPETTEHRQPFAQDNFRLDEMLLIPKKNSTFTATQTPKNIFRCNYCNKTFKTKWTLNSHVAAHEGRFQFQCAVCNKQFVRKSHYDSHVRSHLTARPFACDHCGKTFKESKHRREHVKKVHSNNKSAIQSLLDSFSTGDNEEIPEDTKCSISLPMNLHSSAD